MLKIENLSYSFPDKDLYTNISFTLEDGQHCAFIGTNGTGKTTLIDMIMNPDDYMYDGKLEMDPSYTIGYVSQFTSNEDISNTTVYEYVAKNFITLQNEITNLCSQFETSSDLETLMIKYQDALDEFQSLGGDDFESNIYKKLNLANLMQHKDLMVSNLSAGEFKLIQIIREMLHKPDLLIMDEPDVFLDFENINSLINLINSHKGTLLVITHNRFLLNHCFNKIIHLENTELQEFDGRYIDYKFYLLETKIELQELAIADTEEIERNNKLINKLRHIATYNPDAARGRSLKARVKIQERLEARRIKEPFVHINQPDIHFTNDNIIEDVTAITLTDYSASYEDVLLEDVNFEIKSTDKVAIIGPNGAGKTTLLRDIFNNKKDSIKIDPNMKMAYLSQHQGETLKESNTVYEEFFDIGFETYSSVKSFISDYGFDREIVDHKIESLSGGEKNLLQLAKVSALKANFLLLDEPTSHLDTYSQLALEKALNEYEGGVLMISHDYYTISNCMDYVLIIEDKRIRKSTMKKFRRKIYANHFNRDYLQHEEKKKSIELKIESALQNTNFESAKVLCEQLSEILKLL